MHQSRYHEFELVCTTPRTRSLSFRLSFYGENGAARMLIQRHTRCDLEGFCRLETRGLHLHTSVRSKCSLRIRSLDLHVSPSQSRAIACCDVYAHVSFAHLLHAVGHNLGGEHPFYDQELVKPGESGGLMDYGPPTCPRPLAHLRFVLWST